MNEKNFEYLKDQVKYTGFGDNLQDSLRDKMSSGADSFKLEFSRSFGNDNVRADLHFQKSKTQDNYFFNGYDLSLKRPGDEHERSHSFQIGKDNNITLKEGYNLLAGRSINKDMAKLVDVGDQGSKRLEPIGEKYNTWLKLDYSEKDQKGNYKIKQYHENYGFDLEAAVSKLPLKFDSDQDRSQLMSSLKKGNLQEVQLKTGDQEQKVFIEASPAFKSLNVYNEHMVRIGPQKYLDIQQKNQPEQKVAEQQAETTKKKSSKQSVGSEQTADSSKKTKRKGMSV